MRPKLKPRALRPRYSLTLGWDFVYTRAERGSPLTGSLPVDHREVLVVLLQHYDQHFEWHNCSACSKHSGCGLAAQLYCTCCLSLECTSS